MDQRPAPRGLFVGLAVVDLVLSVPTAVGPNQKVRADGQELVAGGPAANAAITFAALGGQARLLTALGRHPLAGVAHADLAAHGVRVRDVLLDPAEPAEPAHPAGPPHPADPPTVAAIAVDRATGGRQVVSAYGQVAPVRPPADTERLAARAHVVLLDGHHPRLAQAAARAAQGAGVPVLLDGGSWKPHLSDLLPLVDLLIASADFAPPGGGDPATFAHRAGVPAVAVTDGPNPVRWSVRGPDAGSPATGLVWPETVTARDTLGAGDVFHGAVAWALAVRLSGQADGGPRQRWAGLPDVLAFGCEVAARRVEVAGTQAGRAAIADLARGPRGGMRHYRPGTSGPPRP